MLEIWYRNRKTIVPIVSILFTLLSLLSSFFPLVLLITIDGYKNGLNISNPEKYSSWAIAELVFTAIALILFLSLFILRNFSNKFRYTEKYWTITILMGVISLFIANLFLINSEYRNIFHEGKINISKLSDQILITIAKQINILVWAYPTKIFILVFSSMWIFILFFYLFYSKPINKWSEVKNKHPWTKNK